MDQRTYKCSKRSNGLDTELYKNISFAFAFYNDHKNKIVCFDWGWGLLRSDEAKRISVAHLLSFFKDITC